MSDIIPFFRRADFNPEQVKMLCGVLEETWASVKIDLQDNQETLRLVLAQAIMDMAKVGQTDPDRLKVYALSRVRRYLGMRRAGSRFTNRAHV